MCADCPLQPPVPCGGRSPKQFGFLRRVAVIVFGQPGFGGVDFIAREPVQMPTRPNLGQFGLDTRVNRIQAVCGSRR